MESVLNFLEQNKLDKYHDIFQKTGTDGDLLLEADDNVLKELGVKSALDHVQDICQELTITLLYI